MSDRDFRVILSVSAQSDAGARLAAAAIVDLARPVVRSVELVGLERPTVYWTPLDPCGECGQLGCAGHDPDAEPALVAPSVAIEGVAEAADAPISRGWDVVEAGVES